MEHFENLCNMSGVSGNEISVREYIQKAVNNDFYTESIDAFGNLCYQNGENCQLMVCAHMDEVGLIVTFIQDDGTLSFGTVGGINSEVLCGRQVKIGNIFGVIGARAVHNLSPEERKKPVDVKNLYIDIGAKNREEALKYVSLGDFVSLVPNYKEQKSTIFSKALDDRVGCGIMLQLMDKNYKNVAFCFTVQEEVGTRGAKIIANKLKPKVALVLETTTAADLADVSGEKRVCELNKGPVVLYMDKSTIYNRELYRKLYEICDKNGIKCQTKTAIAGGNDAGAIHTSGCGVPTIAVSLPCRYLHSPVSVISKQDLENTVKLVELAIPVLLEFGE